ncbi:MAG: cobyrinate a,c-diamide synthase [Candidatus Desulforudis sp.]|nr:cobyrinate a,c-diamide synthase [Desulforudis sp.]
MSEDRPRVVIAAVQGRSGKTTVTAALIAALRRRNLVVQPFKKGPDFIDPSWLTKVAGRSCRNLDRFLMDEPTLVRSFMRAAGEADVSVVEGAMGLFDGVDVEGSGSTAEIARVLDAPVILVVNAVRMTRSAAAVVLGCQMLDPRVRLAGVVFNNVARKRHREMLTASVEQYCRVPVLGALPKRKDYEVPDRHLGLVPAVEDESLHAVVQAWTADAETYLDIDGILEVARAAPPPTAPPAEPVSRFWTGESPVIGVIRDRAFSFYYPENLEALEQAGARLHYLSALHDAFPEIDGLYIGGGFPEIFAAELEANEPLRYAIRDRVRAGLPVYAECGGLMYLGRTLAWKGRNYAMTGAMPFEVDLDERPRGHGYMIVNVVGDNPFFPAGTTIRGHEFHHSRVHNLDRDQTGLVFRVRKGYGVDGEWDGIVYRNAFAAYNHIHALSVPEWAPTFILRAADYRLETSRGGFQR